VKIIKLFAIIMERGNMKNFLFVLIVFLLVGCTAVRIDTKSIDNIINVILSKENNLHNRVGLGYKYYVPRGISYIDTTDFNEKLYSKGNYYFLYIDVVSYYNQVEILYEENSETYYSRTIDINNNFGYLEINEIDNYYLIEYMYNYAKIEAMVQKDDINDVVLNATYILGTIQFNDNTIKMLLREDFLLVEEVYDVFEPKQDTDKFLRVIYD